MELGQAIMITLSSSTLGSWPFMLWKAWQSKGIRQTFSRRSAKGTGRACKRMPWPKQLTCYRLTTLRG